MRWVVQAMAGAAPGSVEISEPESQTDPRPSEGDPANDWLCVWCHNAVASEKDRFAYEGKSEFWFANPERVRFNVILFSRTMGCRQAGVPTVEHTWFPGHAWSYCVCDQCRMHLGWYYAGPNTFAGLIRNRIVRAVAVRN